MAPHIHGFFTHGFICRHPLLTLVAQTDLSSSSNARLEIHLQCLQGGPGKHFEIVLWKCHFWFFCKTRSNIIWGAEPNLRLRPLLWKQGPWISHNLWWGEAATRPQKWAFICICGFGCPGGESNTGALQIWGQTWVSLFVN